MFRALLQGLGAVGVISIALIAFHIDSIPEFEEPLIAYNQNETPHEPSSTSTAPAIADALPEPRDIAQILAPAEPSKQVRSAEGKEKPSESIPTPPPTEPPPQNTALRIERPYSFPPLSTQELNSIARGALVNILCQTYGGYLNPISGSGVIIDPKGVILTNAHVAQYVLLASQPELRLSCVARSGSPARARWNLGVLYIPSAWIDAHAPDIRSSKPMGTGENDFALLAITGSVDGSPLPSAFPSIPLDTREGIGFVDDTVLLAAYPAEFTGGLVTQNDLYASSAVTSIKDLYTFTESSIDVISLGGVILAQSGSSGGAVVNQWGRLIGIITTTSDGKTTGERDLRAITLSYIDRAISSATGKNIYGNMLGDPISGSVRFMTESGYALAAQIMENLK